MPDNIQGPASHFEKPLIAGHQDVAIGQKGSGELGAGGTRLRGVVDQVIVPEVKDPIIGGDPDAILVILENRIDVTVNGSRIEIPQSPSVGESLESSRKTDPDVILMVDQKGEDLVVLDADLLLVNNRFLVGGDHL